MSSKKQNEESGNMKREHKKINILEKFRTIDEHKVKRTIFAGIGLIGILLSVAILITILPMNSGVSNVADAAPSSAVNAENNQNLKANNAPAYINPKIGKLTPSQKNILREAAAEQLTATIQQLQQ